MNEMISLAIYVGRLEARIEALEKRLDGAEDAPKVRLDLGHSEPAEDELSDKDAMLAYKLMQDGIDNIMGYQGPVSREEK